MDRALDFHQRILAIEEEIGRKMGIALASLGIGMIYTEKEDYDIALDYCKRSLSLFEEMNSSEGIEISFEYIILILEKMDQKKEMDEFLQNMRQKYPEMVRKLERKR